MKPPYKNPPSSKGPAGPKRTRHGGPRPATPRPPGARNEGPREQHRIAQRHAAATPQEERAPRPTRDDRPVLTHRPIEAPTPSLPERGARGRGTESRHPPEAPRGTVWLYGLHPIASALANPQRRLRRLLLTEEAEITLAASFGQPWPLQPERTERARLDQLLGRDAAHQGVALLADPLAPPSLAQALERPGPVLVLDQVTDPRNVGAIMRAAAAFGVAAVITQDRNAPEESGALAKAAAGALEKIPLFRAVNIARTLVALKAAGCWVVGLDAGGARLSGPALRQRRVALVLGSEGDGMRRLTRDTCDEIAGLAVPKGHASEMESLNVSAAGAVALYELTRPD